MTAVRPLLLLLAAIALFLVDPASAQDSGRTPTAPATPSGSASSSSTAELELLLKSLEDPAERDALAARLRALIEANRKAAAEKPPETVGTRLLTLVASRLQSFGAQVSAAGRTVVDSPQALRWLHRQATDPELRATWARLFLELSIIVIAGYAARSATLRLLARPREALGRRPAPGPLAKLPLVLARALLDLLPVTAFALAGYGLLTLSAPPTAVSYAALGFLNASLLVQAVLVATRALVSPDSANTRLIAMGDETAHYVIIWVRRLAFTAVYGYFVAQVALLLNVPADTYAALLKVVGLLVVTMLAALILQNRQSVTAWLRGPAPPPPMDPDAAALAAAFGGEAPPPEQGPPPRGVDRALQAARRRLAEVWHILALVYLAVLYGIWALEIAGGFAFVTRATAITIAAIVAARLVAGAVDRALRRGFAVAPELAGRFPGLETRVNGYLSVIDRVARVALWFVAIVIILQAWGLDTFDQLASPTGRRIGASVVSILFVLAFAVLSWELVSGAIERYLTARDGGGTLRQRSARARTLLPLLRNAFLVVLLVVVALIVLSELGLNIAPLLAGAGVVGLAIGFGAQTLVKDVITGLFILFEDTVSVGDVVKVGGNGGLVEGISIRTLRLRDFDGTLHTIPFSEVTSVSNMTKDFSYYVFNVTVGYREDPDRVMGVLTELGDELRADPAFAPLILAPIEVVGVDAFQDSAILIKARIKTRPIQQWTVGREFNRRMKKRFDAEGIEIPFPQRTVHIADELPEEKRREVAAQAAAED